MLLKFGDTKMILLCISFLFIYCSQPKDEEIVNTLSKYYNECNDSIDDCDKQNNYFKNFPTNPEEFYKTFEYFEESKNTSTQIDNLYSDLYEYISLFMKLDCIDKKLFFTKSINFLIDYYKTQRNIVPFMNHESFEYYKDIFIEQKMMSNIELSINILSKKKDEDIIFFWKGIIANWENRTYLKKFYNKLTIIRNYNKRVYTIMEDVFNNHIKEIKNHHK